MERFVRSPRQLGDLIQRYRKAKGLNQSELADLAGTRQEMVSKIESGMPGTRVATIYDLLAALDLEMTLTPRSRSSSGDIEAIF